MYRNVNVDSRSLNCFYNENTGDKLDKPGRNLHEEI